MLFVAFALGWALAGPTAAKAPLGRSTEPSAADRFLADLHAASSGTDREAIAGMVQDPIKTFISGWVIPIVDRKTFITSFDAFFTDEIKDLVADAAVRPHAARRTTSSSSATARSARCRSMVVSGLSDSCRCRRLEGSAPRGTARRWSASGPATAVAFTGTLAAGEHERYVVTASRNELLDVRVDRVRGRQHRRPGADGATSMVIDARAQEGTRVWTGRLPASG